VRCNWRRCKKDATHYLSWIVDDDGETRHVDDYYCDQHTGVTETVATGHKDTIEFKVKELKK
jgi:hypothetical protein